MDQGLLPDEQNAVSRFARRLRSARLRQNLSQEELAERARVTRKTVVDLEAGKPTVNFITVVRVMSVLGCLERIPGMLEIDPVGEEIALNAPRRRSRASKRV